MKTYCRQEISRGDIYYADLRPVIGSEQGGIRPVLILQNNVGNRHSPTVIAAPITSKMGKPRLPITDEEYLAQLETKREEITHEILERCRTKRKNLYITGPVALNVAQKFSVHRLCDKEGKHNLANRFVGELMEQLVQDGLLVTTKTRNGPGVRTATDAEISSPLPGQQQMTL